LGSRTENAVKNRWNSLIKKCRIEYGIEGDQIAAQTLLKKSSNYTTEEIERNICLMIIDAKEKESNTDGDGKIVKKIEDTPSRINEEMNTSQSDTISEKVEEDKPEKTKMTQGDKKKLRKNVDVDKSKNLLRDLVNQERDNSQGGINPSQSGNTFNPSNLNNLNFQNLNNLNPLNSVKYFPFSNPFGINLPNAMQNPNTKVPPPQQTSSLDANKLIAQQNALFNNSAVGNNPLINNSNQFPNIFNLNDMLNLNILFFNNNNQMNTNNLIKASQQNLIQSLHQNPGKLGMNLDNHLTFPPPLGAPNRSTISLTSSDGNLGCDPKKNAIENMEEIESKTEDVSSRTSFHEEREEPKSFITLKQVPYSEFKISETALANNQLVYAIVDLSSKQLCYITQVTKDTAPPMQQSKPASNVSNMNLNPSPLFSPMNYFNSPMIFGNLPNPNLVNLTNNAPLKTMNKEFTNMHISKSFESSPETTNQGPSNNNKKKDGQPGSTEWTPEIEPKKIFANLNSRDQLGSNNNSFDLGSNMGTPDTGALFGGKNGGSAFKRQMQIQALANKDEIMKTMGINGIDLNRFKEEALMGRIKTSDSPSLFLNTSNHHNLQ